MKVLASNQALLEKHLGNKKITQIIVAGKYSDNLLM